MLHNVTISPKLVKKNPLAGLMKTAEYEERLVRLNPINSVNNNNISFNGGKNRLANVITKMTKNDAIEPVIALEACVVTGRTYQAYKRGKWDEARERFIEEIMGSITWLGGVLSLNWLGDKVVAKILKSNGKNFDVGKDAIRNPFDNFMKKIAPKKFTQTQVAGIKCAKVMTSIILANLFIGFVVPKVNQGLTKKIRHERKIEKQQQDLFAPNKDNKTKDVAFKGGMNVVNGFTNIIENTNAGKLLSSDAGIVAGRTYNARRPEERREILIRDVGSIYFYMWASGHVGNLLNLAESGKATRLNPNTAQILDKHLQDFLGSRSMDVNEFRNAVLGKQVSISDKIKFESEPVTGLSKLFNKKPLEIIKLSELEKISDIPADVLERARKLAELQPEKMYGDKAEKILTKQQVFDAYNKAEINNVKLLHNAFSEFTGGEGKKIGENAKGKPIRSEFEFEGGKYNDEYRFVSNKKLYKLKTQMEQYVENICKEAKGGKIDKKLLEKVKNKNIMFSGINFAAGFAVAAAFLSTLIPKFQYYVTRKTTGVDAFPGTYDYEKHQEEDD